MAAKTTSVGNRRNRVGASGATSLAQRAYVQIKDEILRGRLVMGDILSRRMLAEKLHVSFLPITEALQRLEVEGLVESRPRIGTRVKIPSRQDVLDSYVIREALETQATRLSCEHMTTAEFDNLLKSAKRLDKLFRVKTSDAEDSAFLFSVRKYHTRFHMKIAKLSRSPRLLQAIEREQVLIHNWLYDTTIHRTALPEQFHVNLAEAIGSRNLRIADAAMREHIRFGLNDVMRNLANIEREKGWRLPRSS
jgi:GntR family transcriptional regulator, rspAB operon transcriptional repressor